MLTSSGSFVDVSLHVKPTTQQTAQVQVSLGEVTLENVLALNKLDLEPISFSCYSSVEVKHLLFTEKNGNLIVLLSLTV